MELVNAVVELYKKASTELPEDIVKAIKKAKENNKIALDILNDILKNIKLAKQGKKPICQDTGTPIFYVYYSKKFSQKELRESIIEATKIAAKEIPLRPNAVDPIENKNTGNNVGIGIPIINFEEWDNDFLKIDLMLKGGGSENVSMEYNLPDNSINAGRDIEGIKKCVIDAMFKAQGKGCSPNILGVGIGGTKDMAIKLAKKQLFRRLDDNNKDKRLDKTEKELLVAINDLGIGPLGLGGKTTALGVKIGKMHRHPACFFVAVSFMCWACRRKSLIYNSGVKIE